jgi:hypothetical protein
MSIVDERGFWRNDDSNRLVQPSHIATIEGRECAWAILNIFPEFTHSISAWTSESEVLPNLLPAVLGMLRLLTTLFISWSVRDPFYGFCTLSDDVAMSLASTT